MATTVNRLGQSYTWADVKLSIFGREVVGVTSVEYEEEQEVKAVYGQGVEPVGYGKGNKKYTAKITLDLKEVQGILNAVGKGSSITDIPVFDIVVVVGDDLSNTTFVDILRDCLFMKVGRTIK